jgi:hypothetical protein
VFAEPKVRRRTRASSRGGVWRDLRCGTSGTSGHVTAKSSIRNWDVLYKSGVYALKATCLTPGGLPCALGCRVRRKLAEGRAIDPDRMGEISRRHSSPAKRDEGRNGMRGSVSLVDSIHYTGTLCGSHSKRMSKLDVGYSD